MGKDQIFSAVNTKILGMQARLLKEEDYIQLMEAPHLESQIQYLNTQTRYAGLLDVASRVDEVEWSMHRKRFTDLSKLKHYFHGNYKPFFEALLLRFEIEEIKLILRGIRSEEDMELLMLQSILLETLGEDHPIYRFDKTTTLPQYVENLRDTPYYEVLLPYATEDSPRTLFYMEMVLDRYYYKKLKETTKRLDKEDREIMEEIIGKDLDLKNIEFIYRGKKFYDLLPQEMINLSVSGGYYLTAKDIQRLSEADMDKFEQEVLETRYAFLFDSTEDVDLEMFRNLKRYEFRAYRKHAHSTEKNIQLLLTYLHLTEFEIRDVIAILEGKRYRMNKHEINTFLIQQVNELKL